MRGWTVEEQAGKKCATEGQRKYHHKRSTKAQPSGATLRTPSLFHCGTLRQLTSLKTDHKLRQYFREILEVALFCTIIYYYIILIDMVTRAGVRIMYRTIKVK
jgi:hypothetical protein